MAQNVPPEYQHLAAQFEALGFYVRWRQAMIVLSGLHETPSPTFNGKLIGIYERYAWLWPEENSRWCVAVGFVAIVDDTTVLPEAEVVPFVSRILSSKEAFETIVHDRTE